MPLRRCRHALWLTLALAVLPASAEAKVRAPGLPQVLSTRLATLAQPALRGASRSRQAAALSLPASGPGSLQHVRGGIVVQVRVAPNATDAVARIEAAGGRVLAVHPQFRLVDAAIPVRDLARLSDVAGAQSVDEALAPMVSAPSTCQGSVVSEGDTHINAAAARTQFDVDGTGVKVGVISDSFDTNATAATHAADDKTSGDLPGGSCGANPATTVFQDFPNGSDEGRGMAQIVHDIAPGADIEFATANSTQQTFADNIGHLVSDGAKVVVDDVTYFAEPFFQDGVVSNAVTSATAAGVSYFSSAANNNVTTNPPSYEAPSYRDTTCPAFVTAVRPADTSCHDFDASGGVANATTFVIPANRTVRIDMQWAQPASGVTTDYDLFVNVGAQTFQSESRNTGIAGSQIPFEFIALTAGGSDVTINLAVTRTTFGDSGTPRFKIMTLGNGVATGFTGSYSAPDVTGPTIFGHNGAANAQSVAAMAANTTAAPETYSSRGPVTLYYGPVNGTTPAAALSPAQTLDKPDVTATDCGHTTFFSASSHVFCGTSAAAPHAAGVAALQLQAKPSLTPAQVKLNQQTTATAIAGFAHADVGAGLLNAQAAIAVAAVTPTPTPTPSPSPTPTPTPTVTVSPTATASPTATGTATPPAAPTITLGPAGPTKDATPTFGFTLPGGATGLCRFDTAAPAACSGPGSTHTPAAPLADGAHTFAVFSVRGGLSSAPATRTFTVDTAKPTVSITGHPKAKTRSRKANFRFSTEAGATTTCKLDRAAATTCVRSKRYKKLKRGKHTFTVTATDSAGNAGKASFRWKIK